jgi:hypothetical protein
VEQRQRSPGGQAWAGRGAQPGAARIQQALGLGGLSDLVALLAAPGVS